MQSSTIQNWLIWLIEKSGVFQKLASVGWIVWIHGNIDRNLSVMIGYGYHCSWRYRPPLSWLLLCLISLVALITVLGSSSSNAFDSVTPTSVPNIYLNYRRLKEQAAVDYLELKSLSLGASRQRELGLCGKERENYVPCFNISENLLAGFKDGEEFDRHCEVSRDRDRCLVRPPKDYKIPLRWPTGRDVIWSGNVKITKDQFLSSGSMTKRLMLLEENQITFHSEDGLTFDGVNDYSRQIAEMIGLGSDSEFLQAGVRTVLDIGCGFGGFGAHLLSLKLPYPSLSFDMVHCAQCGIVWDEKDGMFLIEADRVLKPGGYFVLTSPTDKLHESSVSMKNRNMLTPLEELTQKICWSLLAQQDETFIWQKTGDTDCYASRKQGAVPLCQEGQHDQSYYQPLLSCISGTNSKRWIPIQNRSSNSHMTSTELEVHGKRFA
ncbi:hypothetical protein CMV_029863 [Castanea mollissima]|uniref:Methyltransferase n=1 Tax=Castanea mollissima TaxID=60419 RepID=A0A8J4QDG9_9ROSI|nr:hypothetical protein CMV_029863 [Castanea mollissima]